MAFSATFLRNVASSDDKRNVFLSYHAPKVLECVVEGPLSGNDLPISDLPQWTIYEVGIDVAIYDWVSGGHASSLDQNRP